MAGLSLCYGYESYSSTLVEFVPLLLSQERSTSYSSRLHGFSTTIPRFNKDMYVRGFHLDTARLWNCL